MHIKLRYSFILDTEKDGERLESSHLPYDLVLVVRALEHAHPDEGWQGLRGAGSIVSRPWMMKMKSMRHAAKKVQPNLRALRSSSKGQCVKT